MKILGRNSSLNLGRNEVHGWKVSFRNANRGNDRYEYLECSDSSERFDHPGQLIARRPRFELARLMQIIAAGHSVCFLKKSLVSLVFVADRLQ